MYLLCKGIHTKVDEVVKTCFLIIIFYFWILKSSLIENNTPNIRCYGLIQQGYAILMFYYSP